MTPSFQQPDEALHAASDHAFAVDACTPYARATSHPLWRVGAVISGVARDLLLKDLTAGHELPEAHATRPVFVRDPQREVTLYRAGVSSAGLAPEVVACSAHDADRPWILIELVDGTELWQHDEAALWQEAARTLAELHARVGPALLPAVEHRLLVHDVAFYTRWGDRALASGDPNRRAEVAYVVGRAARALDQLLELPPTLIHGESVASNILVRRNGRCVLIDWEMAALGPGLWDLAALAAGWEEPVVADIADAYWRRARELGADVPVGAIAAFDICRVHQCIQWLGWSEGWVPPPEHRRDWLTDAVTIADRLEP